jgi:hypothetical protein
MSGCGEAVDGARCPERHVCLEVSANFAIDLASVGFSVGFVSEGVWVVRLKETGEEIRTRLGQFC